MSNQLIELVLIQKKFKNSVTAKKIKAQTIKDLNIHAIFSCCSILSVRKFSCSLVI